MSRPIHQLSAPALAVPLLLTLAGLLSPGAQALAHEYWLDPLGTHWQAGDHLAADVRNGENFSGAALPFDPQAFSRAGLISRHQRRPLNGRLGDYPAIRMPLEEAGLHLLLLETTRREISYASDEQFSEFIEYHALNDALPPSWGERPADGIIREHYYRYCKALIPVAPSPESSLQNNSAGEPSLARETVSEAGDAISDAPAAALQAQDQRLELIALNEPFAANALDLQLLFEGAPLVARQVELFHRDMNEVVVRTTAQTDVHGRVSLALSGSGDYLVNSVWMLPSEEPSVHWTTLWASLFFQRTGH
ncbi:MAG: DUF4198 domain-containing protein [Granulosicoccus sp.]|nr:DUF4198 domain-containing protein [Granulosicoccus sp.]